MNAPDLNRLIEAIRELERAVSSLRDEMVRQGRGR